jgi:hypothetical protein
MRGGCVEAVHVYQIQFTIFPHLVLFPPLARVDAMHIRDICLLTAWSQMRLLFA